MFTGIIQAIGRIENSETQAGDIRLIISGNDLDLSATRLGDSIAVNGACLTAVEINNQTFAADVSVETMNKTSLGQLAAGSPVNLEMAMTLNTALGGHIVSGHVDGLATLLDMQSEGRSIRYRFEVGTELQHYIAAKGSITVDGSSLTVNQVFDNRFDVNIVPHTQQMTIFQYYQPGTKVNIEVDIIARYLERLLQGRADASAEKDQQLLETLIKSGFVGSSEDE